MPDRLRAWGRRLPQQHREAAFRPTNPLLRTHSPVGAGLPAMVVNDDVCGLNECVVWTSIAGKPAPTRFRVGYQAASLWLLILICPVGRPSAGSAQWTTRHGWPMAAGLLCRTSTRLLEGRPPPKDREAAFRPDQSLAAYAFPCGSWQASSHTVPGTSAKNGSARGAGAWLLGAGRRSVLPSNPP